MASSRLTATSVTPTQQFELPENGKDAAAAARSPERSFLKSLRMTNDKLDPCLHVRCSWNAACRSALVRRIDGNRSDLREQKHPRS